MAFKRSAVRLRLAPPNPGICFIHYKTNIDDFAGSTHPRVFAAWCRLIRGGIPVRLDPCYVAPRISLRVAELSGNARSRREGNVMPGRRATLVAATLIAALAAAGARAEDPKDDGFAARLFTG